MIAARLGWMRIATHGGAAGKNALPFDAGTLRIDLGGAPTASVNLAPAALPLPSDIDASDVAPLEPVPGTRVRHFRGKPSKER